MASTAAGEQQLRDAPLKGTELLFLEQSPGQGRVGSRAGYVAASGFPQELDPGGSENPSATSGNSAGRRLGANKSQSVFHIPR